MIDIDLTHPEVVVLRPEGALTEDDFAALAKAIDTQINETDIVPNLVIRVDRLPHWDSLGALSRHFHFVKTHGKIVRKVAIVGDSPLLALAPEIADHFVAARIRHFPAAKFEDARAWARAEKDDPGRFEEIGGLPRDVVALRAIGVITADDYRETLVPLIEARLQDHEKLKCLIVLDGAFATYTGGAAWEDAKLGFRHWDAFSRVALVSDIGWIVKATRLFAPIMPCAVRTFPLAELDAAKDWIKR
ncbi:STAS/SEC14 domain-containing protein [Tsuneonella sp. YG55]|uniref:STAS/SEC14 domain-containing protein n=1 Tax=Tsuneonella litorea TaxID=2976475 RepID=A0A9X3A8U7_9SPHN|nr:STAS/SEC14 domain-containing protein [Tsuneonella litorea]MCT2559846.1 STAS/SEC14 domain-containing protein [Tsuneonella litorea]